MTLFSHFTSNRFSLTAIVLTLLLSVSTVFFPDPVRAREFNVEVEAGGAWFSRNDVRIPNEGGTRFDMIDLIGSDATPYYRVRFNISFSGRHLARILYAPFTKSGTGIFHNDVFFEASTFSGGIPVKGTYRFSTYRFTYRYTFHDSEAWQLGAGVAGLIRDAKVQLQQEDLLEKNTDLGFVPLVHLYARRNLSTALSVRLDAETLAGPQGRATDAALTVHYELPGNLILFTGYRLLEGGADVEQVYNFSWIHFGLLGLAKTF